MTISEKVAYLKGLAEGMKIDKDDNTGKLLTEIIEVLGEIGNSIEDLEEDNEYLNDYVEELDEDLGDVEEYIFGEDDECDCDCCCDDDEDYDEDDDFDLDDEDYDDEIVEIECPMCGEKICVPPTVDYAHLICPACNEEFSYIEDDDPADEDED